MSRRLRALTAQTLGELPSRCRTCLFWELGQARPDPRDPAGPAGDGAAGEAALRKEAWCSARALAEGPPGSVVRSDGRAVGYALFASARSFAARVRPVPRASDDALLLATLWVEPGDRDGGVGRLLLQAAVRAALDRDLTAVEAYGDRRYREGRCVLPCTWLLHEGFTVHREHPRYPLLRLDVRRTARWAQSLEQALDGVLGRLPQPAPQRVPQPRAGRVPLGGR